LNPSSIIKESLIVDGDEFVKIVESAINLLREENGKIGNLDILGRLVTLEPIGEVVACGDLHGDLESLTCVLSKSNVIQRMARSKAL
jgi:hypothetical protein